MELPHPTFRFRGRKARCHRDVLKATSVEFRFRVLTLLAMACSLAFVSTGEGASIEAKVKSAYLYNLLRRTSWPEKTFQSDDSPYRVTVIGQDNLEGLLDVIADKKRVNKRPIELVRIDSMDEFEPCHMLYVPGHRTPEEQKAVVSKTSGHPCLVVGDSLGFAAAGATANFVHREDGTIGLELNLSEAKKHNLTFDEQLVAVAHVLEK